MMKKWTCIILIFLILLTGCHSNNQPLSDKQFCLDTIVQITLYESQSQDVLEGCFDICNNSELIFSATDPKSELYQINHSTNKLEMQTISDELYEVIAAGLYYSELSHGKFDITVGSVSSLWDFKTDSPSLPDKEALQQACQHVSYHNIVLEKNKIAFLDSETMIDLGAIAKGYIADQIKNYLLDQKVNSALINLGGNILCVGQKNNDCFTIGLTDPLAPDSSIISLEIEDRSVVTSGTYQRYFEYDGKIYHHLLDPQTGYSYDNDLASVTIISESSLQGDALSTVCFALGKAEGIKLLNSMDDVYGCFIDNDDHITYSTGFEKQFVK